MGCSSKAYATVEEVQARMTREMTTEEQAVCDILLGDAALLIDAYNENAKYSAKNTVSCRMVARIMGNDGAAGYPVGATQGSMAGLGYSQSWTISGGGATGELYLTKTEKKMLGTGNKIGSKSPVEDVSHRWRWPKWWVRQ